MAFDTSLDCVLEDCITMVMIAFGVTVTVMIIIHIVLYFRFVKIANERYGENFVGKIILG